MSLVKVRILDDLTFISKPVLLFSTPLKLLVLSLYYNFILTGTRKLEIIDHLILRQSNTFLVPFFQF